MNQIRKYIFFLILSTAPFLAGVVASLHVHRQPLPQPGAAEYTVALSCCCSDRHLPDEPNSSLPVNSNHDCNECLLCHFSAESFWFQPISIEVGQETISAPAAELVCSLMIQDVPSVYLGRAPPVWLSI